MKVKNKRGFTLIEIIIALAIFSIIIVTLLPLMSSSLKMFRTSGDKYSVQSNIIHTSNSLNEAVRESTAIFVLEKNKYDPKKVVSSGMPSNIPTFGLSEGWNYIGSNSDGTKLYNFVWTEGKNGATGKHVAYEITTDSSKELLLSNMKYSLEITDEKTNIQKKIDEYRKQGTLTEDQKKALRILQQDLEDKRNTIRYSITAEVDETSNEMVVGEKKKKEYKIESTVQAVNTKQVIDITDGKTPTAIAYRTSALPKPKERVKPTVAIVLDFSGSMTWNLRGRQHGALYNGMSCDVSSVKQYEIPRGSGKHEYALLKDPTNPSNDTFNSWVYSDYPLQSNDSYNKNFAFLLHNFKMPDGTVLNDIRFYVVREVKNRPNGTGYYHYYYKSSSSDGRKDDLILQWNEVSQISDSERRITKLKEEYKKLIDQLEQVSDMDIVLVPFSTFAYHVRGNSADKAELYKVHHLKRVGTGGTADNEKIRNLLDNISAADGTNYGEGLYVGLEKLSKINSANSYVLALSDGQPTIASLQVLPGNYYTYTNHRGYPNNVPLDEKKWKWTAQFDPKKYVTKGYLDLPPVDYDSRVENSDGTINPFVEYIKRVSDNMPIKPRMMTFIGFSDVADDNAKLDSIRSFFAKQIGDNNAKKVVAGSSEQLAAAFSTFTEDLENDLWYFNGP